MPTPGLIGAFVFLYGALTVEFVRVVLTARQAREEPHGGCGDGGHSAGDNGARNETQRRPPLRPPPPPRAVERPNPPEGLRDLDARVGGGAERRKNMMILMVILATQVIITVTTMLQIGSKTNIPALLELSLCVGIILYYVFNIS